jgi:glutamine synthetase adenylyltransferase
MKTPKNLRRGSLAIAAGACVLVAGLAIHASQNQAHAQQANEGEVRLATYDPQTVFSQSPMQQQLAQKGEEIGAAMQQAQQQGDQQAMQQLQAQFQQEQQQIFHQFEQAIRQIAPSVAEEEGVQVIAADIVYSAGALETTDVSTQLAEGMEALVPDQGVGQQLQQPQQQQQGIPAPQ